MHEDFKTYLKTAKILLREVAGATALRFIFDPSGVTCPRGRSLVSLRGAAAPAAGARAPPVRRNWPGPVHRHTAISRLPYLIAEP